MWKLLRRLVSAGGPARPARPLRPSAATSDILARRTAPAQAPARARRTDGVAFDPYNTGTFDRSASWERVAKREH